VIGLVTGLAGACPKLDRVALICGTLCLLTIFYSALAVLIFDPLAMIINDLCDVLESVRVQGALKGFPGNETLPQCGPTGQFSKVAVTAQNFVDESSSLLCASYGQACNAGTPVAFLSNQLSLVLKLPGCCEDSSQSCRFQVSCEVLTWSALQRVLTPCNPSLPRPPPPTPFSCPPPLLYSHNLRRISPMTKFPSLTKCILTLMWSRRKCFALL
jgi:hypothetical protein